MAGTTTNAPFLSHKIELKVNKEAISYFRQCAGAARFAYNKALADCKEKYESGGIPSGYQLQVEFTQFKKSLEWCSKIPSKVFSQAILNLERAYKSFFKKATKYPKFKSKNNSKLSFDPWGSHKIVLDGNKVRIPKFGWVRLREKLRFEGRIIQGVISEKAGKWFLTIAVEVEKHEKQRTGNNSVGLDLGCKSLVVDSNNQTHEGPKPLKKLIGKLQRLSKSLSRKMKGGKNRAKAKLQVSRLHSRIANVRSAHLHELTTKYVLENSNIAIEDLDLKEMVKDRRISRSISDQSLGDFRRQLEYKGKLYGSTIHVVDRWFPSTKTCSGCSSVKETALRERVYKCENCGLVLDRDYNAALNLLEQIPVLDRELTPTESSPLGSR